MTCLLIALTGAELYVQGLHRVLPLANNIVIFAIVNLNIILLLALVLLVCVTWSSCTMSARQDHRVAVPDETGHRVFRSVPDPMRALGAGGEWPDHQKHQQLV